MKRALDAIFRPQAVAVIGASSTKGKIGRETLHNILRAEFNGKVFPVNPRASVIQSIKSYSTILDVPDAVDLAILIIPKELVKETAIQCGEKGVKGLIVITAGFSEVGPEGKKREEELLEVVNEYGMRMMGPNCFGAVNTDPAISLNATFGKKRFTCSIASCPLTASPTTSMSFCIVRSAHIPFLTMVWSSTTSTFIFLGLVASSSRIWIWGTNEAGSIGFVTYPSEVSCTPSNLLHPLIARSSYLASITMSGISLYLVCCFSH